MSFSLKQSKNQKYFYMKIWLDLKIVFNLTILKNSMVFWIKKLTDFVE